MSEPDSPPHRGARRLARLSLTIIGVGRAGSFAALTTAMLGIRRLRIYDGDTLDPGRNAGVQLYRAGDIRDRRPKAEALPALLAELVPSLRVLSRTEPFEGREDQAVDPVVLLAVDEMAARRRISERLFSDSTVSLLIDVRLGGSVMRCYSVRPPDDVDYYRRTLYRDDETWHLGCAPAPHVSAGAAAIVAGSIASYLRGDRFPRLVALDLDRASFLVEDDGGGRCRRSPFLTRE